MEAVNTTFLGHEVEIAYLVLWAPPHIAYSPVQNCQLQQDKIMIKFVKREQLVTASDLSF